MLFQTKLRVDVMVGNGAVCRTTRISYHQSPGIEWHNPDAISIKQFMTQHYNCRVQRNHKTALIDNIVNSNHIEYFYNSRDVTCQTMELL